MSTGHDQERAWIDTDSEGRIERLSRTAAGLFRLRRPSADDNILSFFPTHQKAVKRDMDTALMGWPEQRTAILSTQAHDSVVVRYQVSLRFMTAQPGLHWVFDVMDEACVSAH